MVGSLDFNGRPFHFIGIGGIGMSALAYVLAKRRLRVSGSDARASAITGRLEAAGVQIFWGQGADNLRRLQQGLGKSGGVEAAGEFGGTGPGMAEGTGAIAAGVGGRPANSIYKDVHPQDGAFDGLPQVICSTAIRADNPEYEAAIALGCPIFHRSDLLAALMAQGRGIAIAGTHGKTTTSSLAGFMLLEAGLDPTIVVGGEVAAWDGNARVGAGEWIVAEADESDGSLVKLEAAVGIVTNIELDHPDHYASLDETVEIFLAFAKRCGVLIGCVDCPTVRDRLKLDLTYSLDPAAGADYWAEDIELTAAGVRSRVFERGEPLGSLQLQLLGRHNLSNALAVVALGRHLGLSFDAIANALAKFTGTRRRFELLGISGGIAFYDDYAHHPSEVRVTLAAARQRLEGMDGNGRLVAIFQPHRFSRTQTFLEDFATAFGAADLVVLTDIYSAGEVNTFGISGQTLADAMAAHRDRVIYQPTLDDVRQYLAQELQAGDLAICLGAGNLNQIVPALLSDCQPDHRVDYQEMSDSRIDATD